MIQIYLMVLAVIKNSQRSAGRDCESINQGQRIFTITQANSASALPQLSHKAVIMQDVRDALAAGKTVTISERSETVANWTGTGYIITDPTTGAGSYLIGGWADGGHIAISIILTMFSFLGSYVDNLALLAGSKLPFLSTVINTIELFRFITTIAADSASCAHPTLAILLGTLMTIANIAMVILFTVSVFAAGPIGAFLAIIAFDLALGKLRNVAVNHLC